MGVDADVLPAAERQNQHQVRGLASHSRQHQELVHRRGHATVMRVDEDPARLLHVRGLVAVEAHRINELDDLLFRQRRHRLWRPRRPEQAGRRRGGHCVAGLRREHGGDQHLERILLAVLGDLLDRGKLEVVDRPRERLHDGEDGS